MARCCLPVIGGQNILENEIRFETPADAVVRVKIRVKIAGAPTRRKNSALENGLIGGVRLGQRKHRRAGEKIFPDIGLDGGVKGKKARPTAFGFQ